LLRGPHKRRSERACWRCGRDRIAAPINAQSRGDGRARGEGEPRGVRDDSRITSRMSPTSGLFGLGAAMAAARRTASSLRRGGCVWRERATIASGAAGRDRGWDSQRTPRSAKWRQKKMAGGFFGGRTEVGAAALGEGGEGRGVVQMGIRDLRKAGPRMRSGVTGKRPWWPLLNLGAGVRSREEEEAERGAAQIC
jgi:hypothetical protein